MSRTSFNSRKITTQNIADALRLLMKVGRDKNKILPRPKGEAARQAWKKEAYELLIVKENDDPIEKMKDIFENFPKEESGNINSLLRNHYTESGCINKNIIGSRIAESQALFLIISKELYANPSLIPETKAFRNALAVCDIISADSKAKESHGSITVRGSLGQPARKSDFVPAGILKDPHDYQTRNSSYKEAQKGVRFTREDRTYTVPRHSAASPETKDLMSKNKGANRHELVQKAKKMTALEELDRLRNEETSSPEAQPLSNESFRRHSKI